MGMTERVTARGRAERVGACEARRKSNPNPEAEPVTELEIGQTAESECRAGRTPSCVVWPVAFCLPRSVPSLTREAGCGR